MRLGIHDGRRARGAIQLYLTLKRTGVPLFAGPKTMWRSRLWNRNMILPGADSASLLSDELENSRNQLRAMLPIPLSSENAFTNEFNELP